MLQLEAVLLGSVVVCPVRARRQSKQRQNSWRCVNDSST